MSLPGHLNDAWLAHTWFRRNDDWDWEDDETTYAVESDTNAVIAHDRESARATLRAQLIWHRAGEQVEGPFELTVEVGGTFAWSQPEATDEDIEGWVEFNAQYLLWPYLRSYVSMITASSGLPPLTLYTITIPSLSLDEDDLGDDALDGEQQTGFAIEQGSGPPESPQ